jgi:phenylpropionate dioxygenase-like ring-hydroxylating dioxygenase large terminal subunit
LRPGTAQTGEASWLHNAWYQAAWCHELGTEGGVERTVLGRCLLLFRDSSGAAKALLNRCPHRFAPLSGGRIAQGTVRCGYHGLAFDGEGRCIENPHGAITSAIHVRSFPTIERHQAVWVWMGLPDADISLIPDLSFIDETPSTARITGYLPTQADYQLVSDNILDLSHADYLHPTSLGGMMTGAKTSIREEGGAVTVEWLAENCTAPPAFYSMVPPPARADIWTAVTWRAPGLMILSTWAKEAGAMRDPANIAVTLHNVTPASGSSCHYFFCSTRKFNVDDVEFNSMLGQLITRAFEQEDKPMLEKQQANIGTSDFWSLKPILLNIDTAAVRARRILARSIDAERTPESAAAVRGAGP